MRLGHRESGGFALVIVISLLTMLVLIIYAISLIGRVDTQLGSTTVYQIQARQNALLGLRLSLAQLQQTAGALNSVTGTAEVLSGSLPANSRWTGVWQSNSTSPVWLISGEFSPSNFIANFSFGTDQRVISESQDNVVMVGNGSTNTLASRYLPGDAVLAPRKLVSEAVKPTAELGHYAYWVGDEGVKLSAQLPGVNPPASPAPSSYAINLMKYSWTPDATNVANVISYEQLNEAGAGATSIKNTFHHVTLLHMSLLDASTRRDGLFNVNTASERIWRGIVETFDSNQLDTRSQNFANEIIAGLGSGPYRTVGEFTASQTLLNAVGKLKGVTAQEFLTAMEDWFAVRSDTFRIRAYGDAMNPADDDDATPESVAYCEAIVQRTTDWLDPANQALGKKFVITYFRWLGPDDI